MPIRPSGPRSTPGTRGSSDAKSSPFTGAMSIMRPDTVSVAAAVTGAAAMAVTTALSLSFSGTSTSMTTAIPSTKNAAM